MRRYLVLLGVLGHVLLVCFSQHGDHLLFAKAVSSHGLLVGWEPSS